MKCHTTGFLLLAGLLASGRGKDNTNTHTDTHHTETDTQTTAAHHDEAASTCGDIKKVYGAKECCGHPEKTSDFQIVPMPHTMLEGTNVCQGKKPTSNEYFDNVDCLKNGVMDSLEQAGADVTKGYQGKFDVGSRSPITTTYLEAGLCPVNVHWHLGAEHRSAGEFDENGKGPHEVEYEDDPDDSRRLSGNVRAGFQCDHYDSQDAKFTTEYAWQHCKGMHVGETYEVHWPHSAAGACGTPNQYQTPFYDGVFCRDGIVSLDPLNTYKTIGVHAQVFTIVNDEHYFYPDLIRGMIVDGEYGEDVAMYTGSTTGTSRSNTVCSRYTPITWHVDRHCHLISASTFDKMCADMKSQRDDMSDDLHAHGSRELVADEMAANNQQPRVRV